MDKKKLNPEQQFFNDKTLKFAKELYDQNEEKLKGAFKNQIKNRDDLLSKIAKILLSYNISDNILQINAADKKKLYSELSDSIVNNIKLELDFETSLTKDMLTSVGKEKFNTNNYVYSLGADFKITQISDEALKKIINTKVENKLWSDRLYDNKNEMCHTLQTEVEKFLKGETNVNQIQQKIIDKYDTNAHETKRLIQDNICRVQEGANDEWQHEHDIKRVMYLATLDGHVCSKCATYDTKTFDIDKKPVEIPRHPFCRCCYISLVNENWHPKIRLDNETKKNINWQSYEKWKESKVKPMKLQLFGINEKEELNKLISSGVINKAEYDKCYKYFKEYFKNGVETPISTIYDKGDRYIHIARRHADMISFEEIDNIVKSLQSPDIIHKTKDKFGSEGIGYIKNINNNELLTIVKDGIITSYYPSQNYLDKIKRGEIVWQKK